MSCRPGKQIAALPGAVEDVIGCEGELGEVSAVPDPRPT